VEARIESLLEQASKKDPGYVDRRVAHGGSISGEKRSMPWHSRCSYARGPLGYVKLSHETGDNIWFLYKEEYHGHSCLALEVRRRTESGFWAGQCLIDTLGREAPVV